MKWLQLFAPSRTSRYRLLGLLPLFLFVARYIELTMQGKTAHILWICHISSLVMALGFFFQRIEFIRISVLWLIIGAPLWPIEIMRTGIMEITSIGTHYIGLLVGLLAVKYQGMGKRSWIPALVWFLLLQLISRLFTPPEFNVNLSHAMYPGWERFFPHYWAYWLFITACSALSLWTLAKVLAWLWKPQEQLAIKF